MKPYFIIAALAIIIASCSTQQKTSGTAGIKEVKEGDSTEYGIVILDPGFDYWYQTHFSTAMDRDNEIYRMYNRTGVMNWNDYFTRGKYRNIIENQLNYDYSIDYGIEVNRKLYWYFKFLEEKYKIRLLH
jgi:hypothetical protein